MDCGAWGGMVIIRGMRDGGVAGEESRHAITSNDKRYERTMISYMDADGA